MSLLWPCPHLTCSYYTLAETLPATCMSSSVRLCCMVPEPLEASSMRRLLIALMVVCYATCFAQPQPQPTVKDFIRVQSPMIALEHVRVIDGTGAAAKADQTIVISGGKITAIGNAGAVPVPVDANRMDMTGYSALPGLVGMHDHLFYPSGGGLYHDMPFSFPRL